MLRRMTKWDYLVIESPPDAKDAEQLLKQLGQLGWELVTAGPAGLYLKRPLP